MAGSILGNRVPRLEDPKFLTTGGVYVDDVQDPALEGALHVTYVRSTVAHGRILSIDTSDAAAMPGVVGVFTADDLDAADRVSAFNPTLVRGLLAKGKVRFVGEPVAVVLTEEHYQGEDAAEAVIVDYDILDAVIDPEEAITSTNLLYEDTPSNVCFDTTALGMPDLSGEEFFADCEVVVSGRFINQRVAACPMEVRGSAAAWVDGRLYQWLSTQHAHGARAGAAQACGIDEADVRIIVPDVGGGFGAKIGQYPEEALLGVLARKVGRPVTWRETRSESMVGLGHGRGQIHYITIGGTRDGMVTHYQLRVIQDCGAAGEMAMILPAFMTRPMAPGVYAIPNVECRTTSVLTNTTPLGAYRGAGRPEATAAIERAMDMFAAEIGMDPVDVRRKNLIPKFTEPYTNAMGQVYDVGDYEPALDKVLAAGDYAALRAEQAARRASGDPVQIGIGVSTYVEITGRPETGEYARVQVHDDGSATVYTGTSPHGQGHWTSWAMLAYEQTGIPIDRIELVFGDTDRVPKGGGTFGSRSLQQGGTAVFKVAGELAERAKQLAAKLLEADVADVVLDRDRGAFHVAGTPSVTRDWADLAQAAHGDADFPDGLDLAMHTDPSMPTFPFGAHLAVVEVDTETGNTRLVRHIACDDAGTVLNPMLLEGQIHGGIAQGAAQALLEEFQYDAYGNPITANLADYSMISATELPMFEVVHQETPTFVNPLGAKGIGESGTIGSTPAVQSAVIDAVSHLGIRHIDMPCTPERLWSAIKEHS